MLRKRKGVCDNHKLHELCLLRLSNDRNNIVLRMPGVPQKTNSQLALTEEAAANHNANPIEQPRQPHNLQGLLRFAMEAQNGEPTTPPHQDGDVARPLNEDRRQFLEQALSSMTVDVIKLMKDNIEVLQKVENITEDQVQEKINAFDNILDYIDNIDIANDFHKINGFLIFDPCLKCEHHQIRASACDLLAELAQNNPYIQNVVCNCTSLMVSMLDLLENDPNIDVQTKALYAISCITRDSVLGYANFKHHNGFGIFYKALSKDSDKIRTKITFLLSSLHRLDTDVIQKLVSMDYVPLLLKLLEGGEWKSSDEHILSLLHMIIENDENTKANLKKPEYRLKEIIDNHIKLVDGKDEYLEEQIYCKNILDMVQP